MNYITNQPHLAGSVIPHILDKRSGQERVWDLWSRLHADRIIFLGEEINDYTANLIVGQLLQLEADDRAQPIQMYINSPGGSVNAGLAIYDVMNYIEPEVRTICVGVAASMAAVLLSAGTPKYRYIMPSASVMLHQPRGGAEGVVTDMEISLARSVMLKEKLNRMVAKHTGQTYKKICEDVERDLWFSAEEAKKYGLIDTILTRRLDEKENK